MKVYSFALTFTPFSVVSLRIFIDNPALLMCRLVWACPFGINPETGIFFIKTTVSVAKIVAVFLIQLFVN